MFDVIRDSRFERESEEKARVHLSRKVALCCRICCISGHSRKSRRAVRTICVFLYILFFCWKGKEGKLGTVSPYNFYLREEQSADCDVLYFPYSARFKIVC